MTFVRRAIIDIGTNAVKVLVAEVCDRHVRPLWEDRKQTRLGEGFYDSHQLQPEAIHATAHFAAEFVRLAQSYNVEHIRIIATSAARDAVNQADFLRAVEQKAGLKVDVISGEQEAELTYRAVTSDEALDGHRLCILEVGGGSAQFMVGEGADMEFAKSFELGGVRLLERFQPSDPPRPDDLAQCRQWLTDFFAREIQPAIAPALGKARERTLFLGTGGTATTLMRMINRQEAGPNEDFKAEGIPANTLIRKVDLLWSLSLSERKRLIGLKKKRADVIPFGAVLFETAVRILDFTHLRVSKRGIRYGAVQLRPED